MPVNKSIVRLTIEMIEPYRECVHGPVFGSGGMFVISEKFVEEHDSGLDGSSLCGQESNQTTWKLSFMNLAIRSIDDSEIKWNFEGSFLKDEHRDLQADFFIVEEQKAYIADWGKPFISSYNKPKRRLRVIYDYGIESDLHRFGFDVEPCEWSLVPLTIIEEAIQKLIDGNLPKHRYKPKEGWIIKE